MGIKLLENYVSRFDAGVVGGLARFSQPGVEEQFRRRPNLLEGPK